MEQVKFKLNGVELKDFRIFGGRGSKFETSDKDLILVFGPNNEGKSSLAKAVMFIESITKAQDFSQLNFIHKSHNLDASSLSKNKRSTQISLGFKQCDEYAKIYYHNFIVKNKVRKNQGIETYLAKFELSNSQKKPLLSLEIEEDLKSLKLFSSFKDLIGNALFKLENHEKLNKDLEDYIDVVLEAKNEDKYDYFDVIKKHQEELFEEARTRQKEQALRRKFKLFNKKYHAIISFLKENYQAYDNQIFATNWNEVYQIKSIEGYYWEESNELIRTIMETSLSSSDNEASVDSANEPLVNLEVFKQHFSEQYLEEFQQAYKEVLQTEVKKNFSPKLGSFESMSEERFSELMKLELKALIEEIINVWIDEIIGIELPVNFKSFQDFKLSFKSPFEEYFQRKLEQHIESEDLLRKNSKPDKSLKEIYKILPKSIKEFLLRNSQSLNLILSKENQVGEKYLNLLNQKLRFFLNPVIEPQSAYFYGPKTSQERILNLAQPKTVLEKTLLDYLRLRDKTECKNWFKKLVEASQAEVIDFNLKVEKGNFYSLEVLKKQGNAWHNFADLGMGYGHFVSLLIFLALNLSQNKTLFFIEEPCNHLHPQFHYDNMANLFVNLLKINDIRFQAIIETHSQFFIAGILSKKGEKEKVGYVKLKNKFFETIPEHSKNLGMVGENDFFIETINIFRENHLNYENQKEIKPYEY